MQAIQVRNRVVLEGLADREQRLVVRLESELGRQFVAGQAGRIVNIVDRSGRLVSIEAESVAAATVLRQTLGALMADG
jgi:hypothetical protein